MALDLPDISVPNIEAGPASEEDRAHLRAVAPLYFASELERTALLPAVEALAALFGSGAFAREVGAAGPRLINFWRGRSQRFSAQERAAMFTRLFGTNGAPLIGAESVGGNFEFESLLLGCIEALIANEDSPIFPAQASPANAVRLQIAVTRFLDNLSTRAIGIAPFAAREIISAITTSLEIVREPALQRAFGTSSTWAAVRAISRQLLRRTPSISEHVARAQSGQILLAWFAEELPHITSLQAIPPQRIAPALTAANAWIQATLSVSDLAPAMTEGAA